MEAKARNWRHARVRSQATIQWEIKSLLKSFYLNWCSVFRPAKCSDWLSQEVHILWELAEGGELLWAGRERSNGPPRTPAPTASRIKPFAQSSCVGVGTVAHPFCCVRRFGIISARVSPDCNQDVVDTLLTEIAIVSEPTDCGRPYLDFVLLVEGDQGVRVFRVRGQTLETLLASRICN